MVVALLVIDMQYDFLPGGSLAVPGGDDVIPIIQKLLNGKWDWVIASQDYHPPGHVSFASTHSLKPFTSKEVEIPYVFDDNGMQATIQQMLWPDHCVQGTRGAAIEQTTKLELDKWFDRGRGILIQKGKDKLVDAYSAFASSPPVEPSESPLSKDLRSHNIDTIFAVGLATDYCVRMTALDAKKAGFNIHVIDEAVRAVGGEEARKNVLKELQQAGISFMGAEDERVKRYL